MTAALIPHPAASRHAFRAQVCRLVDRLITMLDEIDGDPDLEDGHDAEDQCEDEGAQCEDEGAVTGDDEPDYSEGDRSWPETGDGPQ